MIFNIINTINFALAQTKEQKEQTIVAVCLLALGAVLFIMDRFAKNTFAKDKVLGKILMLFSVFVIVVVVAMLIFYR